MRNQYWTSDKPKVLFNERREQLTLLFEFVNADLNEKESDHLRRRIQDLLNVTLIGNTLECPSLARAGDDLPATVLQRHLRDRFDEIILNAKSLVEMPWLSLRGSLKIAVDVRSGRFIERFVLHDIYKGDEKGMLRRLMDVTLINIFRDLDSKPNRFHQCPRCGIYYYQPTQRAKNFCSKKCNDVVRLREFRKKRSLLEDNEPK